ncbi:OmpA family protein [Spirochaetes bacterium]|uniref:OmpA family protein n=1 Tax=Candidatus Scatousia excrementipullorum TaxID=2840936 RepID=A0A9D9H059_9BACT|nr:OmpA family protein [Candidatus Scatousia excrementipullorum]
MKYILLLSLFMILSVKTFAAEVNNFYPGMFFSPEIIKIENVFRAIVKDCSNSVVYTRVPRGLIVSVVQSELFDNGSTDIKRCGLLVLNALIKVLKTFNNRCVIESHTDELLPEGSPYTEDWEVSIRRANKIAAYIVKYGKIPPEQIFPLGFGNFMPFKETVSRSGFSDSRIDFVIIVYDYKR